MRLSPNQLNGILGHPTAAIHLIIEFDDVKEASRKKAHKNTEKLAEKAGGIARRRPPPTKREKVLKLRRSVATLILASPRRLPRHTSRRRRLGTTRPSDRFPQPGHGKFTPAAAWCRQSGVTPVTASSAPIRCWIWLRPATARNYSSCPTPRFPASAARSAARAAGSAPAPPAPHRHPELGEDRRGHQVGNDVGRRPGRGHARSAGHRASPGRRCPGRCQGHGGLAVLGAAAGWAAGGGAEHGDDLCRRRHLKACESRESRDPGERLAGRAVRTSQARPSWPARPPWPARPSWLSSAWPAAIPVPTAPPRRAGWLAARALVPR